MLYYFLLYIGYLPNFMTKVRALPAAGAIKFLLLILIWVKNMLAGSGGKYPSNKWVNALLSAG